MNKYETLIHSLHSIKTDMRNAADLFIELYPGISSANELNNAASVISKWIDNIENGKVYE